MSNGSQNKLLRFERRIRLILPGIESAQNHTTVNNQLNTMLPRQQMNGRSSQGEGQQHDGERQIPSAALRAAMRSVAG